VRNQLREQSIYNDQEKQKKLRRKVNFDGDDVASSEGIKDDTLDIDLDKIQIKHKIP
jgi:hypothetical protein